MSDYLMRTLIRQRHEQIQAEVRAGQRRSDAASKDSMTIKTAIRRFRMYLAGRNESLSLQPTATDEGNCP